jgi:hypothetical protein
MTDQLKGVRILTSGNFSPSTRMKNTRQKAIVPTREVDVEQKEMDPEGNNKVRTFTS